MALLSQADVLEMIEPIDPDSVKSVGRNEFLLNWIHGGYSDDDLASLKVNRRIQVLKGPYQPEDQTAITHQIRIKVLTSQN